LLPSALLVDGAALAWTWGPFLGYVLASALVGYLFDRFVVVGIKNLAKRTQTGLDDLIVKAVHPALVFIIFFFGVGYALWLYEFVLPARFVAFVKGLNLVLITFLAALTLARVLSGVLHYRAKKEVRWEGPARLATRVLGAVIWVMAFLVILDHYRISITPVLTSLGIAGLAVALALQDTLSNFFSGLWIQTGQSLSPGHYIKVEDKNLEGFVVEVGWRTTKLRALPGNIVIIPNAVLAQSTITDYWLPEPKMGTSLEVVTGFETDPDRVVPMIMEEIVAATKEVDYILDRPEPFCRLNKRVDNGWQFWMSFWVPFYYNQWNAQGYVLNKIRKRFLREGIRIPLPVAEEVQFRPERSARFSRSIVGHATNGDHGAHGPDAAVPASRPTQQAPTSD
jgi:small-conductance mechanosensitive channel